MTIKIKTTKTTVTLHSHYTPGISKKARALGGRFDNTTKTWKFDIREETKVRALAMSEYGTDGTTTDTITIRMNPDSDEKCTWFAGRMIARRPERDRDVQLGEGVILIEGDFHSRGGSRANPTVNAMPGTIVEVRDVPARHEDIKNHPDEYEIVDEDKPGDDIDELMAERERLLERVAQIDAKLPEPTGATMSTREAAVALGVSVRTVQRWARAGKVDAKKNDEGKWEITITV